MQYVICVGDGTSHGGKVLNGSNRMSIDGRPVARKGDMVSCPKEGHGTNPIIEGSPTLTDDGVPVALHGHKTACGCTLIASGTGAGVH
ncbi:MULTISPECIES: PAAR domain-containing protein [Silvimonas]|uniref:PAAR domain-containing protein n=1 Tax=Silvimonas TaxID=300264 RepID=UPI0024B3BA8F|nr:MULTISPECIES: PAAR domain-containing protein [Silvimonas]MDR3428734.1 PAAR domain-containing protein [Silvimonas sp.]